MRPLLMMLARSALSWPVLASAVLIAVMAIGLSRASVTAETPVYADPAGACNGLTPCFTTIQEAVDEVDIGGEVFVFPGTYAESVSLSDMNAGSPGTISLTTVGPAGTPAPGTATVDPGLQGPAFYTLGSPFTGDVTMNGFIVTSTLDNGVFLDVVGDVVIANMTADTCKRGETGCLAADAGNGFKIDVSGNLTISNSTASGNGADGFDPNVKGNLTICDSTANDNGEQGMELDLVGDLFLNRVTVMNNSKEGIEIDGTTIAGSVNLVVNVTIQNSRVEGNARDGITLDDLKGGGADLINGNIIALNGGPGLSLNKDVLLNAQSNWWGDASGPTHLANTTGTGDEVVDGANGGSGTVDFSSWVASGSGSAGPGPAPITGTGPCPLEDSIPDVPTDAAEPPTTVGGAVQTPTASDATAGDATDAALPAGGGPSGGAAEGPASGVGSLVPAMSTIPVWAAAASALGGAGLLGSLGALAARIFRRKR